MPIAQMEKINLIAHQSERDAVLETLQRLAAVEIKEIKNSKLFAAPPPASLDQELSETRFAIEFLKPYKPKKGLLEQLTSPPPIISLGEINALLKKFDYKGTIEQCKALEAETSNLNNLRQRLKKELDLLFPWINLKAPLNELKPNGNIEYLTGSLKIKNLPLLEETLKEAAFEVVKPAFAKASAGRQDKKEAQVLIACRETEKEPILNLLAPLGFNLTQLPASKRTAKEEIKHIQKVLYRSRKQEESFKEEAEKLSHSTLALMCLHDYFQTLKAKRGAESKTGQTQYTFVIEGWVKKKELKKLAGALNRITTNVEIVTVEPKEGETPPVAIENSSLIKPFESVTEIYGFPKYRELDPTPLLAVFFILFFGFCLGDAGYGITLSLVTILMYKKFVLSPGAKKILKLLFYGGVASAVAGILSGGWFGVDPANFPPLLKAISNFLLSIRIIDPLKNPISMLILALAFGIIHITFGKLISFYLKWREKQYLEAVCDDLLWIFFLLSLVLAGMEAAGAIKIGGIGWKLAGTGAVLLVLTQGRAQKNIIMKLVSGVLSLYGTVGYLSDVLSYSRILALGLATTIIAMVINLIAEMTKGIPFVGYLVMIAILIFGHIFNIIINVLGAFIHSGRLQFVEFFSKFLEGGGKEFKPFRRETNYVQIE